MYLLSDGIDTHIMSKKKLNPAVFILMRIFNKINRRLNILSFLKKETKTFSDSEYLQKEYKQIRS
jgi:hypothetical protein